MGISGSSIADCYLPPKCSQEVLDSAVAAVCSAEQLAKDHREILICVMVHMRCPDAILARIGTLNPVQMAVLAEVFYVSLAEIFHGWKPRGSGLLGNTDDLPFRDLADVLGLTHMLGTRPASISVATAALKPDLLFSECSKRQLGLCYITHNEKAECSPILPHSVMVLGTYRHMFFWLFLALLVGPDFQEKIWEIAGGENVWGCTNGILLSPSMHKLFHEGQCSFHPDPGYDATSTVIDVTIHSRGSGRELGGISTTCHSEPAMQVTIAEDGTLQFPECTPMFVRGNSRFRFFTVDPANYPLPHPILLELHHTLWSVINTTRLNSRPPHGWKPLGFQADVFLPSSKVENSPSSPETSDHSDHEESSE